MVTKKNSVSPTWNLNPAVWSKLPHDVICGIINWLDTPDLIRWSCVNRVFFPYASARVWKTLHIKDCEIETYGRLEQSGTELDHPSIKRNIVHFLTHDAHRQDASMVFQGLRNLDMPMHMYRPNARHPEPKFVGLSTMTATLPGSLVRHLQISNREESDEHQQGLMLESRDVLSRLFVHLDGLRTVSYDGRLKLATFSSITEIRTLTSLSLRVGSEESSLPAEVRLPRGPWTTVRLDLGILSTLPHLRTLRVGHLMNAETEGLARSVTSLKLDNLLVSCIGWLVWHSNMPKVARHSRTASPLVALLHALATLQFGNEQQPRGFPPTLRSLSLRDRYGNNIPLLHQRLASLITHCKLLADIELLLLISGRDTWKAGFDSLDIPSHNITVGMQSWDELACTEKLPVMYNQWCPRSHEEGAKAFVVTRLPQHGSGFVINIAKVLDEIIAHHFECESGKSRKAMPYLRRMNFSKMLHQNYEKFQAGVVEVHWTQASLVKTGRFSIGDYLRYIGFRKPPVG